MYYVKMNKHIDVHTYMIFQTKQFITQEKYC